MSRFFRIVGLVFCIAPILLGQGPSQGPGILPVLPRVDITVLVENMSGDTSLLGEWGLSLLIETDKHRVLLDAGGGRTLFENARALSVDLAKMDAVVISH